MKSFNNPLCQDLGLPYPLWQAPLPFGAITAQMSAHICARGALGLMRLAAHETIEQLEQKMQDFQSAISVMRQVQGAEQSALLSSVRPSFCLAHPMPKAFKRLVKQEKAWEVLSDYFDTVLNTPALAANLNELLDKALSYQPKALGFMHGLPSAAMLKRIHEKGVSSFVVCHSVAEALVADRSGVDILVLQGTEAGGERCGFQNDLGRVEQPAWSLLQQVRKISDKPLILWGDFSTPLDMLLALMAGAQSVMLDRWWLACRENDLPETVRERVLAGNECQSTISWQYTHAPMRCLQTSLTQNPLKSALGEEALFELGLQAENMPLPLALSAIEDPVNLTQFLTQFRAVLADYVVEG